MKYERRRHQKGQALVELALLVPFMALIVFGLIEFGFMFNDYVSVVNASRNGARVAAHDSASTNVNSTVSDSAKSLLNCSTPTATTTQNGSNPTNSWTVTVSCTYTPFTPYGSRLGPLNLKIQSSTTMRDGQCIPSNSCTG